MTGRRAVAGVALACAASLFAHPVPAFAQDQAGEAAHEGGHLLRHEVSLVLAGTYEPRDESEHHGERAGHDSGTQTNLFTLGGEYEYRIHRLFGIGGTVEYITRERNWLFVFAAVVHPYRGLKLLAGPGFERRHEEANTELVLRFGAA